MTAPDFDALRAERNASHDAWVARLQPQHEELPMTAPDDVRGDGGEG